MFSDLLSRFDISEQYKGRFFALTKGSVLEACAVSPSMFNFLVNYLFVFFQSRRSK